MDETPLPTVPSRKSKLTYIVPSIESSSSPSSANVFGPTQTKLLSDSSNTSSGSKTSVAFLHTKLICNLCFNILTPLVPPSVSQSHSLGAASLSLGASVSLGVSFSHSSSTAAAHSHLPSLVSGGSRRTQSLVSGGLSPISRPSTHSQAWSHGPCSFSVVFSVPELLETKETTLSPNNNTKKRKGEVVALSESNVAIPPIFGFGMWCYLELGIVTAGIKASPSAEMLSNLMACLICNSISVVI
ncbi:hypothetical protein RJT34_13487 [Clitoria ternatea]|uniref:Uncharacterized protein n=1 Tax=Clitoria ternatea TaxID=43366 RepID=A0AAN9JNL4_CLITE